MGLGALGAGVVATGACNVLPWGKSAGPAPADVDRLLRELDVVVAQLKSLEPDVTRFGMKRVAATPAGEAAVKQLLTTMCFMGTYRDVPEAMWHEPRVETRLADTLPLIHTTVEKARTYVAALSAEEGARIDKRLREDPDLTMRIMERVDDYAKQVHVPFEQRTYLRAATAQLAGRFRYEGTKEVTAKLAAKYARSLASRKSELGMDGEGDAQGGGEEHKTDFTPLRVQFHTHASSSDVHAVTCAVVAPTVTIEGAERPIVIDWEEFRCPVNAPMKVDDNPIRAAVHVEAGVGGENIVTVVLYPPADASGDALTNATTSIGRQIQQRLVTRASDSARALDEERAHFDGQACTTSANCGPLRCIDDHCADPFAPKRAGYVGRASSLLGSAGESCRSSADCDGALVCTYGACKEEGSSSAKLINTTGKVAKWGAILLIPPICAVGVLVLLTCLFMVIVAGCMYAGGD
jgi:hypothetical protein